MAAAAQMAMGNAYARGDGVEKNPQLAQEWYDKARISPAMTYTRDTSSSPECPQQALTDGQGHTVYERGHDLPDRCPPGIGPVVPLAHGLRRRLPPCHYAPHPARHQRPLRHGPHAVRPPFRLYLRAVLSNLRRILHDTEDFCIGMSHTLITKLY